VEFQNFSGVVILHHVYAGNIIAVTQPDLSTGGQAEPLFRCVLTEILSFDIEYP
jgi:hypothetical protein